MKKPLFPISTGILKNAVEAGKNFLQIRPSGERGANTSVKQIEEEEEEKVLNPTEMVLAALMQTMQQLVNNVDQL